MKRMKPLNLAWRFFLLAVLATALPVAAANLNFLKNAPISKFTDEDLKIFTQTRDQLLNTGKDGETREWSNPATKASGKIIIVKSFKRDGVPCRTLKITNRAQGLSETNPANFCQQAPQEWTLAK
jgi:hypothetical protein